MSSAVTTAALTAPETEAVERAVIGALLIDPGAARQAIEILSTSDFYSESYREIFRVAVELSRDDVVPDLLTTTDELRRRELLEQVGGAAFLSSLTDATPDVANVSFYARRVRVEANRREFTKFARRVACGSSNPEDLKAARRSLYRLENPAGSQSVGTLLSNVEPKPVRWLWKNRVPLGKITVIDGDPGTSKSTLTNDIAARVATGREMPDGSTGIEGGVVMLNAEDDPSDTIGPRLIAAGADPRRVVLLGTSTSGAAAEPLTFPDDLDQVRAAIDRVDASLVVVDPLMAYLGGKTDSHKDQDVRRVLAQLSELANDTGAAVVIVRHLNKMSGIGNPIYRGGGSIGIIGAARSGLLVAFEPLDNSLRVVASTKSNLGREPRSIAFRIGVDEEVVAGGEVPFINWEGYIDRIAADLVAPPKKPPSGQQARIIECLNRGLSSISDIADALDEKSDNVARMMQRMADSGRLTRIRQGEYELPVSSRPKITPFCRPSDESFLSHSSSGSDQNDKNDTTTTSTSTDDEEVA